MKNDGGRSVFYATDLCNFVSCSYLTYLDRRLLIEGPSDELRRSDLDDQARMITEKGREHEARYLQLLRDKGNSVAEISRVPGASAEEEAQRTRELLKEGHDYLFQAAFYDGVLAGYADFLVRVDTPSELGDFSYEVIDSKLGSREKGEHLIQLCFYSDLLGKVQGVVPRNAHLYLGTKQLRTFRISRLFEYYKRRRDEFLREANAEEVVSPYPEPCAHCRTCHWQLHCKQRWQSDDHLSLVANITKSQIKRLNRDGISTVKDLASTEIGKVHGISDEVLERLREQAALQVESREDNNNTKLRLLPPRVGSPGFAVLPSKQVGDLFYDIEGDPLVKEEYLTKRDLRIRDGLEYLHGFTWLSDSGKLHYRAFWALSKARERRCFEALMDFLAAHTIRYPSARIYHYSAYEISALKRLSSQYPSRTEVLDNLLRGKKFVDLYRIVQQSIRVSEPRYSIKNLERFYSEKRELEVENGGASIVWFEEFLKNGEIDKLKGIKRYNKKDCESTYELFVWLHNLKKGAATRFKIDWSDVVVVDTGEERQKTQRRDDSELSGAEIADARVREYAAALGIDAIQAKKLEDRSENDNLRELLFYLSDFYRREMKPVWWQYYDWQERPSEMIEEPECLGQVALNPTKPIETIARSNLVHYTFPTQETKLSAGSKLFDTLSLRKYGEVYAIDTDLGVLSIKLSKGVEPLPYVELAPEPNNSALRLVEGLDRFLQALIKYGVASICDEKRNYPHPALIDILRKQPPVFKSGGSRKVVVAASAGDPDFAVELLNAALDLDNSYLFIQGPPGTGKTYHAARLTVSLMKRGKRIAITSNSHKAIHNLLKEIDQVALEEGFSFRGVKKSDKDDKEKQYNPRGDRFNPTSQIVDILDGKLKDFDQMSLVAGTAWAFIAEEQYQSFDYLIIDEASQLSLAHLVSAGICARNLILIGDPQQLPQPLQGIHPGELSLSPLEFLLNGEGTVPTTMGIFLDVCRRMHNEICEVLSNHVYDGRLHALDENRGQRIINPVSQLVTRGSGILFNVCEHDGNTSSSPEEVARVVDIYHELLGCTFCDKEGSERLLSTSDIMVISPFNIQVGNLRKALGANAEVGTIDLFQGREAPVVIISMTTSNVAEAPRGLDFLFSQQRINVALSRAKALAILVASPQLVATRCKDAAQMELVNFFCSLAG